MKVRVVTSYRNPKEWTVELSEGVQHFRLDYTGAKKECFWYARMFRQALKAHDWSPEHSEVKKPRKKKAPVVEMENASA